jgi:hypothetical protein
MKYSSERAISSSLRAMSNSCAEGLPAGTLERICSQYFFRIVARGS